MKELTLNTPDVVHWSHFRSASLVALNHQFKRFSNMKAVDCSVINAELESYYFNGNLNEDK